MAVCIRRPASSEEKQRIVDLHQEGKLTYVIASIVGRSTSVVKRIVAKFKCSESTESALRYGRHRKMPSMHVRVTILMTLYFNSSLNGNLLPFIICSNNIFMSETEARLLIFLANQRLLCQSTSMQF